MNAMTALRPALISNYENDGVRHLMPVTERELIRTETFLRRVLRAEAPLRGRFALLVSTFNQVSHLAPFERVLMSMGVVICCAEANPWDGARIESTIRRFDVAVVAVVTETVLGAIRSLGHDPLQLLRGKIVWAEGPAYDELEGVDGIDLRRWITVGPVLGIEGRQSKGAFIDTREWTIEPEGDVTYVSSRLDRVHPFDRLAVKVKLEEMTGPDAANGLGAPYRVVR